MLKQDFKFDLPKELIADQPAENRTDSRLLVIDPQKEQTVHRHFHQLVDFIEPNDCLIFNNTRVIPARLKGVKESGGSVEVLIERVKQQDGVDICLAQLRASNTPKAGAKVILSDDFIMEVIGRESSFFVLKNCSKGSLLNLIEEHGQMPLPPYIERAAEESDNARYQTVYADKLGAVAAPTAGLHFDQDLLDKIADKGVSHDFVTLHVGAGTFSPVRVDDISDHQMHSEWFSVPQSVVDLIETTREKGGRVIAVGTTSVRCLESASVSGEIAEMSGETDIFITPGYRFKSVDALITNFHLSESTLMMLVSAFAGREFMLSVYQQAIEQCYRFFSYGDAMLIENKL
jgi:S-adenosylmethionine:tRNA ribosyltransferase-isomerase